MCELSDLADKYEILAVAKERFADRVFEASQSADALSSARLLDEAESFLSQARRFRAQAEKLRRQIDDQNFAFFASD